MNMAARMETTSAADHVHISGATRALLDDRWFVLEARPPMEVPGMPCPHECACKGHCLCVCWFVPGRATPAAVCQWLQAWL